MPKSKPSNNSKQKPAREVAAAKTAAQRNREIEARKAKAHRDNLRRIEERAARAAERAAAKARGIEKGLNKARAK